MRHAVPLRGRGGEPLPAPLRQRLEAGFGADLAAVRLHGCAAAQHDLEALGAIACAVDGAILLRPGAAAPAVLAHEVAHLLQARVPGRPATTAALEAEADRAAAWVLAGGRARLRHRAAAGQPLCWEEAGHYYTVYFVALACGLTEEEAGRLAFWTQFSDEVSELDAVKAGFAIARNLGARALIYSPGGAAIHEYGARAINNLSYQAQSAYVGINNGFVDMLGGYASGYRMAPPQLEQTALQKVLKVNLDVQKGLHCLTGRDWNVETALREKLCLEADRSDGDFQLGVAMHCLGDSFAHRDHDSGKMYPPFIGHGPETKVVQIAGDEFSRMTGAVHPDSLASTGAASSRPISRWRTRSSRPAMPAARCGCPRRTAPPCCPGSSARTRTRPPRSPSCGPWHWNI